MIETTGFMRNGFMERSVIDILRRIDIIVEAIVVVHQLLQLGRQFASRHWVLEIRRGGFVWVFPEPHIVDVRIIILNTEHKVR